MELCIYSRMKIICQLYEHLILLINYLRSVSIYKLLVNILCAMCLACVAVRVDFILGY